MTSPVRPLLLLTAATAAFSASILLLFAEDTPSGGGMSIWLREVRRREQLQGTRNELVLSMETTRNIVDALAEGRTTLREAANALREERERRPYLILPPPSSLPEEAVEEYYLRSAVEEARLRLEGQPREHEVMRRLQREVRLCLDELPPHPQSEFPPLAQK